ncbi:MAG: NADH-quinone oxidoreductase subunit A [Saezia sp.]
MKDGISSLSSVAAQDWAFAIFLIVAIGLCCLLLLLSYFLGGRSQNRAKHKPYESGLEGVGTAHQRFSLKFYLVAMFFVIFDVVALFLYAWAVSVREVGWLGYFGAAILIAIMLSALFYLVRIGALEWLPERYRQQKRMVAAHEKNELV